MRTFLSLSLALLVLLCFQPPVHAFQDQTPEASAHPPINQEPPTQQLPNPTKLEGKVTQVIDHVTLQVNLSNGKQENVRLLQIHVPTDPSCGPEALDRISKMILGKTVQLELGSPQRDKQGRLLAYVYVNGKSVQQALLNEGLAKVSPHPSKGKYADQYRAFEDHAKTLEKGVWAPVPCGKEDNSTNPSATHDSKKSNNKQPGTMKQQKAGNGGGSLPKTGTQYPTQALLGAGILLLGLWIRWRSA